MKRYSLKAFLALIFVLLTIACSSDDNGGTNPPDTSMDPDTEVGTLLLSVLGVDNTLVRIDDTLSWQAFEGDNLQYSVFLGTTANNMEQIAQLSGTSFPLETELEVGTDYFWKVAASDATGLVAESEVSGFTTEFIAPRLLVESAAFSPRRQANTVSFNGKLWHMGGVNEENPSGLSEIWSSENGIDWVEEPVTGLEFERVRDYFALEFNGRLWLSGQFQLYSSENGVDWIREPDPPFVHFGSISMATFNGTLWRFAGFNGTIQGEPTTEDNIYSSSNGTEWVLEADNHGFTVETGFSVVNWNDVLYGMERFRVNDIPLTVIRTSTNGVDWEELSRSDIGDPGFRIQMVEFNNSLIIVSGSRLQNYFLTTDGINWELATTRPVTTQLFLKNFAELNGTLYAVGGGAVNPGEEGNSVWIFN